MADQVLRQANKLRYRFHDPDLDLHFHWSAGAAMTGGVDAGGDSGAERGRS